MPSGPGNTARPTEMLQSVWQEYRGWARTSRVLKVKQERTRNVALSLGVLGAACGTAAGAFQDVPWLELSSSRILAGGSAGFIAIAGYVGRELLTPDRETGWARSRIMAEALKREVWRYVMHVPPYDTSDPGTALRSRVSQFFMNTGLQKLPPPEQPDSTSPPEPAGVADYTAERVIEQIGFYEKRAREHQRKLGRNRLLIFVLGLTAVLFGLGGLADVGFAVWVPVITTASAALVALVQAGRLESIVPLYLDTATQLRFLKAAWMDGETSRADPSAPGNDDENRRAEAEYVENCEAVMATENDSWRVEWVSEEAAEKAVTAFAAVQEAADSSRAANS
jgi:hypothetical protein